MAEEVLVIIEQSKKDNQVDADGDGDADVDELKGRELLKRKMLLVLKKMNPQKVNSALASIYKGMLLGCIFLFFFPPFTRSIHSLLIIPYYFSSLDLGDGSAHHPICKDHCHVLNDNEFLQKTI